MADSSSETGCHSNCDVDDLDNLCKILHEELNQTDLHGTTQLYLECHGDETNDILLGKQIEALRRENEPRFGSHIDIQGGDSSIYRISFPDSNPGDRGEPVDLKPCNICDNTFTRASLLLDHKACVHNMTDLFPCSVCPYKGQRYRHWYKHVRRMHPQAKVALPQDLIVSASDKIIPNAVEITEQHNVVSANELPADIGSEEKTDYVNVYPCRLCSKTFPKKRSLMYHKRTHAEKTHCCSIPGCTKAFKSSSAVNEHKTTVHGAKVYKCTHANCTKSYALKRDLDYHVRAHTDMYSCLICSKTFRDRFNLSQHTKTHTGQKDVKCDYCDYSCIQSCAMKSHVHRRHADKEGCV